MLRVMIMALLLAPALGAQPAPPDAAERAVLGARADSCLRNLRAGEKARRARLCAAEARLLGTRSAILEAMRAGERRDGRDDTTIVIWLLVISGFATLLIISVIAVALLS